MGIDSFDLWQAFTVPERVLATVISTVPRSTVYNSILIGLGLDKPQNNPARTTRATIQSRRFLFFLSMIVSSDRLRAQSCASGKTGHFITQSL
jgi:hypothetical protein